MPTLRTVILFPILVFCVYCWARGFLHCMFVFSRWMAIKLGTDPKDLE